MSVKKKPLLSFYERPEDLKGVVLELPINSRKICPFNYSFGIPFKNLK
jgi:hypothetical protein